jgi:hypothetical protein
MREGKMKREIGRAVKAQLRRAAMGPEARRERRAALRAANGQARR